MLARASALLCCVAVLGCGGQPRQVGGTPSWR